MKATVTLIVLLIWLGTHSATAIPNLKQAPETPATARLKSQIEGVIVPSRYPNLKTGIMVASLDRNDVLYQRTPDEPLIPASVSKVLTSYAILKKLKPSGTFTTAVYSAGTIKNGVLTGDIYLKGGGDPSLVSERLWMLVNDFMRHGIKRISGNIIGDASYFDTERTPVARPTYLQDEAYNAPVGALSFNFNTTTIYVKPGPVVGAPPLAYVDPQNDYIEIVNQAKTSKAKSSYSLRASRTPHVKGDIGDIILLRGTIPLGYQEVRYYRNIVNPSLYTLHMFKTFLERRNVSVGGIIKEGKLPPEAKLLMSFDSIPMWHVVWGMNKFSNNFVADQLLKKMGAEMWGVPGSLEKGITSVKDALEDIGIARNTYHLEDGSGLTRKSRVTARQIMHVLRTAYRDFAISPEFVASLGIAGEDGTLRRRFPTALAKSLIRAKTGTLNGVTALAGYTPSQDGELLAFVILLNDPKFKYGYLAAWVDKIALAVRKFSRK